MIMEESRSQKSEDRRSLARARELLRDLDKIKGSGVEMTEWSMRAQTFLVFEAARQHCSTNN